MFVLRLRFVLVLLTLCLSPTVAAAADPLRSWNDCPAKQKILDFVARTTAKHGPDYLPLGDRIATFDNDGTLWSEQPYYNQFAFVVDRVRAMAPAHPEWRDKEPFRTLLSGDAIKLANFGENDFIDLLKVTHAGMTADQFNAEVVAWISTARHPRFGTLYTQLTYQPMVEVLAYLRANGYKTFIVSGGGVDFMRPWTERAYGIPPQQVAGSSIKVQFSLQNDKPVLLRLPTVDFIADGPGKPVGIYQYIGKQPVIAFGNSDGDLQMLQYTTVGAGKKLRLGLIVHHTDAVREWAYDRDSKIGRLRVALDQAPERGWQVIDMKNDWRTIFSFQHEAASSTTP